MTVNRVINHILLCLFVALPCAGAGWERFGTKDGLVSNYVKCLRADAQGVWVGTAKGAGRYLKKKDKWVSYRKRDGLADDFVNDIAVDGDHVWFATIGGVSRLALSTGKWKRFTKAEGLADNQVTCILVEPDRILFGTRYWGVSVYDKRTGGWAVWTVIDGLPSNAVTHMAADGDKIWFATQEGLGSLDTGSFTWEIFSSENTEYGLARNHVLRVAADRQYVWCATGGEGVCRYDKENDLWAQFSTRNVLSDDFVLSTELDGRSVWAGTFGGVNRFDSVTGIWTYYGEKEGLPEPSVTAIAVDGNRIWFGLAGGGVCSMDKGVPMARLSGRATYERVDRVVIRGTACDWDDFSKYDIMFRMAGGEEEWSTKGIVGGGKKNPWNGELAVWDPRGLMDGTAEIRLRVEDRAGNENVVIMPFKVDNIAPVINIDQLGHSTRAKSVSVSGSFFEDNLDSITVNPGGVIATVDPMLKSFSATVRLAEGHNRVEVLARDRALHEATGTASIIRDTVKPVLSLEKIPEPVAKRVAVLHGSYREQNLVSIVIEPGSIRARVNPAKKSFQAEVTLKKGDNRFTATATDVVGHTATAKVKVVHRTRPEPFQFKGLVSVTTKSKLEVRAKIADPKIESVRVETSKGKQTAALDPKRRELTATVNLAEGINLVTFKGIHADGRTVLSVKKIVLDTVAPRLSLEGVPACTARTQIRVEGTYTEENLDSILVNGGKADVQIDRGRKTFSVPMKLRNGSNTISVVIRDGAGQSERVERTVLVDTQPPALKCSPVPAHVRTPRIRLSGTARDANLQRVEIEPAAAVSMKGRKGREGAWEASVELKRGANTLVVRAFDRAGLESRQVLETILDMVPPKVKMERPDELTDAPVLTVAGTCRDAYLEKVILYPGGVEADVDGENGRFRGSVQLQAGANILRVEATDRAGNVTVVSAAVVSDREPPRIITDSLPEVTAARSVVLSGRYSDESDVRMFLRPKIARITVDPRERRFEARIDLAEGENRFEIIAVDALGHQTVIRQKISYQTENWVAARAQISEKSEQVERLRGQVSVLQQKIQRLQDRPGGGPVGAIRNVPVRRSALWRVVDVPSGPALFFAPYRVDKGDTISLVSGHYLGSTLKVFEIERYNRMVSAGTIRSRGSIMVPNRRMIDFTGGSHSQDRLAVGVIETTGEAFNAVGPRPDLSAFSKSVRTGLWERELRCKPATGGTDPFTILSVEGKLLLGLAATADEAVTAKGKLKALGRKSGTDLLLLVTLNGKSIRFERLKGN